MVCWLAGLGRRQGEGGRSRLGPGKRALARAGVERKRPRGKRWAEVCWAGKEEEMGCWVRLLGFGFVFLLDCGERRGRGKVGPVWKGLSRTYLGFWAGYWFSYFSGSSPLFYLLSQSNSNQTNYLNSNSNLNSTLTLKQIN